MSVSSLNQPQSVRNGHSYIRHRGPSPPVSGPTASPTPPVAPFGIDRPGRVLVVDDERGIREMMRRTMTMLGHGVELAADGIEALAKLPLDIDLVMLDAEMPNMDGFEVARRIRKIPEYADLPIIMITGRNTKEDRVRAAEVGINDFVQKPFDTEELRLRSASLLKLKRATDELKSHGTELENLVRRRTMALREALDEGVAARRATHEAHLDTIKRLVRAAEYKDEDTGGHIERIGMFSEVLADGLGMGPRETEIIRHAAPMHDVGKIGIPDRVLLKRGPLDDDEWAVMRSHTVIGSEILRGSPSEILKTGAVIALSHHEKWNGTGYPLGLAGEAIPLEGRICAVADVFDALTSHRRYRPKGALPNEDVYEMMEADRGEYFDPEILDVFLARRREIERIQEAYRDEPSRTKKYG